MTAPDNKNLSDDDYLDAEFSSDLDEVLDADDAENFDHDEDDEDLFAPASKKKSRGGKIAAIAVVAAALLAGAGFYYFNSRGGAIPASEIAAVPSVPEAVPEVPGVAAENGIPSLPGIPVPASDFDEARNTPDIPAVAPEVPASAPEVPEENPQASVPEIPSIPGLPSEAEQDQADLPPPAVPVSEESSFESPDSPSVSEGPLTPELSEAEAANAKETVTLENIADLPVAPRASASPASVKQTPVKQVSVKQQAARPSQTDYFDAPQGKALSDLPPSINRFGEPGENLIIVHKSPVSDAILEKGDNTPFVEARLVSANRAFNLGKYDAALEFYDELKRNNPRDPRILMGRAVTLQKLSETQKAIEAYQSVLDVQPDNPEAITNLMGLIGKTKPAVALENLLNMREKFPRNPAVAAQLGIAYAQSGNPQDGLKNLQTAAALQPDNALHYFNMAVVSEHMNDPQSAIKYYEQALDTSAIYGPPAGAEFSREQIYDRLARLRGN